MLLPVSADLAVALAMIADEGCYFVDDITVIGFVAVDVVAHVAVFAQDRFVVDTADTENLQGGPAQHAHARCRACQSLRIHEKCHRRRGKPAVRAIVPVDFEAHFCDRCGDCAMNDILCAFLTPVKVLLKVYGQ